ncbi:hypothetical protein, partial [Enterococcus faecalis]|uniref:hypothetical protein n=1 Tax=Enterococcus faecalis TaxID=1351 RepID=UPI00403F2F9C
MELHLDPRGPNARPSSPGRPGSGQSGEGKRRSRLGRVFGGIGWLFGGGSDWSGASSIRRG